MDPLDQLNPLTERVFELIAVLGLSVALCESNI
jgi:hypothetical protein